MQNSGPGLVIIFLTRADKYKFGTRADNRELGLVNIN